MNPRILKSMVRDHFLWLGTAILALGSLMVYLSGAWWWWLVLIPYPPCLILYYWKHSKLLEEKRNELEKNS